MRKIAVRCDRCQDKVRSRFRTLFDAFWCDRCNDAVRAGADVEMSVEEREARLRHQGHAEDEAPTWEIGG